MNILYFHEFIEQLEGQDKSTQKKIRKKLKELYRTACKDHVPLPLKGSQFKGLYKLRVDDWRLIYKIVKGELHFITLGHRSEVYKNK